MYHLVGDCSGVLAHGNREKTQQRHWDEERRGSYSLLATLSSGLVLAEGVHTEIRV